MTPDPARTSFFPLSALAFLPLHDICSRQARERPRPDLCVDPVRERTRRAGGGIRLGATSSPDRGPTVPIVPEPKGG